MISRINEDFDSCFEKLRMNTATLSIKSNFLAYGGKYEFCQFYTLEDENKKPLGVMNLFNSALNVSFYDENALEDENLALELFSFLKMSSPEFVNLSNQFGKLEKMLKNDYELIDRSVFVWESQKQKTEDLIVDKNPKLDSVYKILSECFDYYKNNYSMWLVDTSHRVRHNFENIYVLNGASALTVKYQIDGWAYVCDVATLKSERGKGYSKKLLGFVCEELIKSDFVPFLLCEDELAEFYKKCDFVYKGKDKAWFKKDN